MDSISQYSPRHCGEQRHAPAAVHSPLYEQDERSVQAARTWRRVARGIVCCGQRKDWKSSQAALSALQFAEIELTANLFTAPSPASPRPPPTIEQRAK
eukprot:2668695-Prymnesium_polylepis.1